MRNVSDRAVTCSCTLCLLDGEYFTAEGEVNCGIEQAPHGSQFLSLHEPFHQSSGAGSRPNAW